MNFDPARIDAQLPRGVADFLPDSADKIGYIQEKIGKVFELWGFRKIMTPMLEFEDVLALGIGEELRAKTFRFDDRQSGRLLAVPPDVTPQVARIFSTRMRGLPLPQRLSYHGRVLRHAEHQSGRNREILQSGVELIGLESPEADAEMVAMAVEALQLLGFTDFKIDIGQVEFFRGILESASLETHDELRIRHSIAKKDISGLREILKHLDIPDEVREAITSLPRLYGDSSVLASAELIAGNDRSRRALENISQVLSILDHYEVTQFLTIDLGEIRGFDYHTGLTFEGFVAGIGEPVCSGGRYDNLTSRYGVHAPATGFAFSILPLLAALEKQPEVEASTSRDFLLFNAAGSRTDVLRIAKSLRRMGYSAARDIIQRDFASSLEYAKVSNIRRILVIGGELAQGDDVYIQDLQSGKSLRMKKSVIIDASGKLDFDSY
jgi:ATP phosphoribosyltransferase regulatory subunit